MIKKAEINTVLNYPVEDIWDIITNNENNSWKYDVKKYEKISETEFFEININNLKTIYTIEEKKPFEIYKLKMKNKNINGIFNVYFKKVDDNRTNIRIYQENEVLNISSMIASSLFLNLQKILNRYIYDVEQELKRRNVTKK